MTIHDASPPSVTIGGIFQKTFSVYGNDPGKVLLISLICHLPVLALALPGWDIRTMDPAKGSGAYYGVLIASILLPNLCATLSQGIIAFATFRSLQGQGFPARESAGIALSRIGGLVVVSLLMILSIFVAAIALLIPALIVAIMFYVAVPAYLVERTSVVGAFKRSRELTKGYRWRIFGVFILMMIVSIVLNLGLGYLGGLVASAVVGREHVALLLQIISVLIRVVVGAFAAINSAVIYSDLRNAKEGVSVNQIADVFA